MTIESELIALTDTDGFIKPRVVLDWAKDNPTSEVYRQLEWDDAKAAEEHRLSQVRRLIVIHVRQDDGERATISLVQDRTPEGGYRHIAPVMTNRELREMAVRQALRELRMFERRYKHLQELAAIFAAANTVEGNLQPEISTNAA